MRTTAVSSRVLWVFLCPLLLLAGAACGAPRILFLGNSLTLHAPAPAIGWTGNWGMAASAEDRDYVHLLTGDIAAATGETPDIRVYNVAGFEREYEHFDCAAEWRGGLEFRPGVVIVAVGENVPALTNGEAQTKYAAAFARMLAVLKEGGNPSVFVRGCFWPDPVKDAIMRQAAEDAGAVFVDVAALGRDPANAARSEREIAHAGVAGHPGDRGMRALAAALFTAIRHHTDLVWPDRLIGHTVLRTALPGGRHANVRTMRAVVVKANGTGPGEWANALIDGPEVSTQFAGWSPDGRLAVINRAWKSPENARWEEENRTFRFRADGCSLDAILFDPADGRVENVTGVNRVSFYNSGLFFWPGDPGKLGFTALIDGQSHPFRMDRDGRNKTDLTSGAKAFSYGFSSSRDGRRIAWHQDYRIVIAGAGGEHPLPVETGNPFNFGPVWSPDGQWLLFVSGTHENCHPCIVRADGTGLRKLADRGGYRGVVEFLDVPDFHGGSSDTPVWSGDGRQVIYTAQTGGSVELHRVDLDGRVERLTRSPEGTLHYHPAVSPDGRWLVYGSKREGVRQLFVRHLVTGREKSLTHLETGYAAMWPHWQP